MSTKPGSIQLGGAHLVRTNVGYINIARLQYNGALDTSFGNNGYFDNVEELRTANGLYASHDGIRALTLQRINGAPDIEKVAKILE